MIKVDVSNIKVDDCIKVVCKHPEELGNRWNISYGKISLIEKKDSGTEVIWAESWADFNGATFIATTQKMCLVTPLPKREYDFYILSEEEFTDKVGKYFIIGGLK